MTDFQALLTQLHQNLDILQQRQAKYGDQAPLELLNQISDHQTAIGLTERARQGRLAENDWREAIKPLLVAIENRTGPVSSVTIGDVAGGIVGSIIAGRDVNIHLRAEPDPTALRQAYLNRLLERCSFLSLSGIDRRAAGAQSDARLHLSAVYTALLTYGLDRPHRGEFWPDQEENRPLSALAQLDRHPRLVLLGDPGSGKSTLVDFVSMCLAGQALSHPQVNLALLTAPLPDDDGEAKEAQPQPWQHGPLLPVPVILRDFAARGLPPPGQPATAEHLWRFIAAELKTAALGALARPLAETLHKQGGLLLLDGLDEVPEADQRRTQLKAAVEDFARTFTRCRILVTSRTYAYQKQDWRLTGFAEAVLAPFSRGQIRRFVEGWYRHMVELRGLHPDDAAGRAEQLKTAIFASERLSELAARPLLLTLMSSLHAWRGGTLPEKREELYADTVDLLLDWWESPKTVKNAAGQTVVLQPSLAEWLAVDRERVRALLSELAYAAHAGQPELVGTADVAEDALVGGLLRLSQNPDLKPARLVEYLSQRAGLLLPRGVGVYTFPHRTFQEYLAACHLTDADFPDRVADLARTEPNRWREVALLAGAKAGRGSAFAVWALIEALCYRDLTPSTALRTGPQPPLLLGEGEEKGDGEVFAQTDAWGGLLAGQLLLETTNLSQLSPRHRPKIERIRAWLAAIMEHALLPAVERAAAGSILAQLPPSERDLSGLVIGGDPRRGVGLRPSPPAPLPLGEGSQESPSPPGRGVRGEGPLPDILWRDIPAGPFLMGSDPAQDKDADKDEQPQHRVDLPAFRISRYPITQAQYRAFVEAGGYAEAGYWTAATVAGYWQAGRVKRTVYREGEWIDEWAAAPADFGPRFSRANQPVVGVNWFEAVAFCHWLTARLRQAGELGQTESITLPSERQWEKAARGGLEKGEARIYPWGNEPDPNRANYDETKIGATSAVGCFPGGASPDGVEDMAGNVWEWCRTQWQERYQDYTDDTDLQEYTPRVVRGGAFNDNDGFVRCAVRLRDGPRYGGDLLGFRVVSAGSPSLHSEL